MKNVTQNRTMSVDCGGHCAQIISILAVLLGLFLCLLVQHAIFFKFLKLLTIILLLL